jgi:hypothetical protein
LINIRKLEMERLLGKEATNVSWFSRLFKGSNWRSNQ